MPEAVSGTRSTTRTVVRRPHIRREGSLLRFLVSRRPLLELTDEEVRLFEAIKEPTSVGRLSADFSGARETLREWHQAEIVEFVLPVTQRGRHLVVIEPHMDDAALSVGGGLALRAGAQQITILSATRESNVSCYWTLEHDFFDAEEITALRDAESRLAAELVGARHRALDRPDAPLRFLPEARWQSEDFTRLHDGLASYLAFPPQGDETGELAAEIGDALRDLAPDELWIPLGAGGHVDHRMTRDACLLALQQDEADLEALPVYFYEDHPYSSYFPGQVEEMVRVFSVGGLGLEEETEDVTTAFDDKLRQVSVFASQFKVRAMEGALRSWAERLGDGSLSDGALGERRFRIRGLLKTAPTSRLAPDWLEQRRLRAELSPWVEARHRLERLVIIAGAAFGRFDRALAVLLEVFPAATLHVYADRERAWDVGLAPPASSRWTLEPVAPDRDSWRAVCDREARHGDSATVVVRFPPWPLEDSWREQILKSEHPAESAAWHRELAERLGDRPLVFCRHLGDVCGIAAELAKDVST